MINSNNLFIINNFMMKCIDNIFYLFVVCGIGPKKNIYMLLDVYEKMCIFSCECPIKEGNLSPLIRFF